MFLLLCDMLKSIEIKNWRGLQDIKLQGFNNINFIVGDNGSGKTSLLEAIFLSMGNNVQSAISAKNLRYNRPIFFNIANINPAKSVRDFFIETFYNLEIQNNIYIRSEFEYNNNNIFQTFQIKEKQNNDLFSSQGAIPANKQLFDNEAKNEISVGLDFIWTTEKGEYTISPTVTTTPNGVSFNVNPSNIDMSKYMGSYKLDGLWVLEQENTMPERFSILSSSEKKTFRDFLGLEELELKLLRDGVTICGREKNSSLKETLPLVFLSSGLNKIINILISATSVPENAILLIDEIENGIFYKRYPKLINYLNRLAKDRSLQFFITTHSKDFVVAAKEIIEDETTEFSLIQMDNHKAIIHNENILQAVIENEKEFR